MLSCISLLGCSSRFRITDELWNITSALYLYSTPGRATVTRTIDTSPSSDVGCYTMRILILILFFTIFACTPDNGKPSGTTEVNNSSQNISIPFFDTTSISEVNLKARQFLQAWDSFKVAMIKKDV